MSAQLVFDLPQRVARGRDVFLVAPSNDEAVALIDEASSWSSSVQWLYGPSGCGKTHLAAVLAEQCETLTLTAAQLSDDDVANVIERGATVDAVIVEALDGLSQAGEEALFHLLNHAKHAAVKMLLLSRQPAAQLDIKLPDLASRLKAVPAVQMAQPDDALMCGLLDKLFADRQVKIDARVVDYLVPRISRDFAAMGALVMALDKAALAAKKPITVPFVSQFLDSHKSVM